MKPLVFFNSYKFHGTGQGKLLENFLFYFILMEWNVSAIFRREVHWKYFRNHPMFYDVAEVLLDMTVFKLSFEFSQKKKKNSELFQSVLWTVSGAFCIVYKAFLTFCRTPANIIYVVWNTSVSIHSLPRKCINHFLDVKKWLYKLTKFEYIFWHISLYFYFSVLCRAWESWTSGHFTLVPVPFR